MERLLLILLVAVATLNFACSPNGRWNDIETKDETPSQSDPNTTPDEETVLPSTQGTQLRAQILSGAEQVTGNQVSGIVTLANDKVRAQGAGIYGQIEISISRN